MKPHWPNPYKVVYVPIVELAECHAGLGQHYRDLDGSTHTLTRDKILEWWGADKKVDAYILPQPSGEHCIGVRYGAEDHEYLSPLGDRTKVAALLRKYQHER